MKKAFRLIFSLSIFFFIPVADSFADTLIKHYDFEKPVLITVKFEKDIYHRIVMPNCPNGGKVGAPALPSFPSRLLIPAGERITDVEVIPGERVKIGQKVRIEPCPMPERFSAGPKAAKPPIPDAVIYESTDLFPRQSFEDIGTQHFRGYAIHILRLTPIVYNPATGDIWYYPRLTVKMSTSATAEISELLRGREIDETDLRTRIDNMETAVSYRKYWQHDNKDETGFDMLVLTTTALAPAFAPLESFHDAEGISTEIRCLEDIGNTTPEGIREFIRTCYQQYGIHYLLIGGDDDVIPVRGLYVSSGYYTESAMPADIYYACLNGTYNFDGDNRWGEPTDGENGGDVDLIAEVFVGRAPVGTLVEAQRFVTKTLWYLSNQPPNVDRVQLVGEYLGFGGVSQFAANTLNQLVDGSSADGYATLGIPSLTYVIDRLYDATWPTQDWPMSELITRINNGVHLLNHLGHGDVNYAMKLYSGAVMSGLNNSDLCFVYSQTCLAGHFDQADCWAETVTIKSDHAAFAAIMNARYGFGDYNSTDGPSQRFNREFWDAVFNPAELKPQLGRANHDSKEDNLYRINDECMRWCYYELNLFGDPTLIVRTPNGLFIRHSPLEDTTSTEDIEFEAVIMSTEGSITSAQAFWTAGYGTQTVTLQPAGGDLYRGMIPGQSRCSTIEYWITATDSGGNTKRFPPEPDVCSFQIATYSSIFSDTIEYGTLFWDHYPLGSSTLDQWAVRNHRNHTDGGSLAWKFGPATIDGVYNHNVNAALVTPSVRITETAALYFWMWGALEEGYSGNAYDGGWVEMSVDGGPFQTISPTDGYPYTFSESSQPCWSGDFGWTKIKIELDVPLQSMVTFRFCFKSDISYAYEGWYIDDISVDGIQCNPLAVVPTLGPISVIILTIIVSLVLLELKGKIRQRKQPQHH